MDLLIPLVAVACIALALGAFLGYLLFRARYFDDAGQPFDAPSPPSPRETPRPSLAPLLADLNALRADLADPALLDESRGALDELTAILDLGGGFYPFQRV